ncbi:MAG: 2-phospho-L-lactate guanylyltransferase [Methanomicrobiales archaeon]|nr:2-phospho-L-lactate guanylyltransferase [Methanomicrobiales archaeon]
MCPHALIPYKPRNPKTRLSEVLEPGEREKLAAEMLEDVLCTMREMCCMPVIVATELFDHEVTQITVTDADLNQTLNEILPTTTRDCLIIMADLPLADEASLKRLVTTGKDMAIVPGRGGGTNVIYLKEPWKFRVAYYGASFLKHMKIAEEAGLSVEVIDSFRLHTDIDEPDDLVELLIHGKGRSRAYLEELGFTLSDEKGRVGAVRKR